MNTVLSYIESLHCCRIKIYEYIFGFISQVYINLMVLDLCRTNGKKQQQNSADVTEDIIENDCFCSI